MIGELVLAGVAGASILALSVGTLAYRGQIKDAEAKRDEAIKVAAGALEAKKNAEEGFLKAKEFFEKHMQTPVNALMTDEQVDRISAYLGGKLFLASNTISEIKQ